MDKPFYTLDNSGIIHLAAIRKWHTDSFRFSVTLTEEIDPFLLQEALNRIIFRFPTIAAGITKDAFQFKVVPVSFAPSVTLQQAVLTPMTNREIENCAFRVLYFENQIVGEFFHSLTDGYGGSVFMTTLLAEYLHQKYGSEITPCEMIFAPFETPLYEELKDDYFTYAGEKTEPLKNKWVYQLPGKPHKNGTIQITSRTYDIKSLLDVAHKYDVSLTTFLTTVMAVSISEIQERYLQRRKRKKPIQIMVPVNLRHLFPSNTLRNFSLFALPRIEADKCVPSFGSLLEIVREQLEQLVTKEKMAAAMATHTKLEKATIMKVIPLFLKCAILRAAHHFLGEMSSCISLSNLGIISFPKEMSQYIEQIDFVLTPRIKSPYNCGIVTYENKCIINISRLCVNPELEECFFRTLSSFVD